jgi:prepilin-type N-terminal cleavage/methylation domain-containing protein
MLKSMSGIKTNNGFTIVELLIVIVVIGILAAISLVAFNGVQNKAKNTQTAQALNSWVRGMKLYKTDVGRWPNSFTCLGQDYPYGQDGTGTSGPQCRQDHASAGVNASFHTSMRPYLSPFPMPGLVTWTNGTNWYRGLSYLYGGGGSGTEVYVMAVFAGNTQCLTVEGLTPGASQAGGNTLCTYLLGATTDS